MTPELEQVEVKFAAWWREVQSRNQRGICWLTGTEEETDAVYQTLFNYVAPEAPLLLRALPAASENKIAHMLGTEHDFVLVNAHDGFTPNLIAAITGTVRSPGLLVILSSLAEQWPENRDSAWARAGSLVPPRQFIKHIVSGLLVAKTCFYCAGSNVERAAIAQQDCMQKNVDERHSQAIDEIIRVATGRPRRPLLISADRGRGKSAVMGMAAAKILEAGHARKIAVCGPASHSVDILFRHAQAELPSLNSAGTHYLSNNDESQQIKFLPVDELLRGEWEGDLLLVDEAAAIPLPTLLTILERFKRVVMATTLHGYEGTGRGFKQKFLPLFNQGRCIELSFPVRWGTDDPLERWLDQALLLSAEGVIESQAVYSGEAVECTVLQQSELLRRPELLHQVFGLLALAHYRTSPNDLRTLLDQPELNILVAKLGINVVGVIMLAREGGMEPALCKAVESGERRPHGHVLPQILAFQMCAENVCQHLYSRVMRIAVHPGMQRKGIGKSLLTAARDFARERGDWMMGASFGYAAPLINFWERNDYQLARVGIHREKTSGHVPILMLAPLTDIAADVIAGLCSRGRADFCQQIAKWHSDADIGDILHMLHAACHAPRLKINRHDERLLAHYAATSRPYEVAHPALKRLVDAMTAQGAGWQSQNLGHAALLCCVSLSMNWSKVSVRLGLSGRKEIESEMRRAVESLLLMSETDASIT